MLFNWRATCAMAKRRSARWPVDHTLEGALKDLEASFAAAQMVMIAPGGREVSWLRNGSGLDLSLRCDHRPLDAGGVDQ